MFRIKLILWRILSERNVGYGVQSCDASHSEIHSQGSIFINSVWIPSNNYSLLIKSLLPEELDSRHVEEKSHYEDLFQVWELFIRNLGKIALQKRIADAVNKKRIKKEVKKERDELDDRHEKEKSKLLFSENDEIILDKLSLVDKESISSAEAPVVEEKKENQPNEKEESAQVETSKLSKTAKRRLKKEQEEKERKNRIKAAIDEERSQIVFLKLYFISRDYVFLRV